MHNLSFLYGGLNDSSSTRPSNEGLSTRPSNGGLSTRLSNDGLRTRPPKDGLSTRPSNPTNHFGYIDIKLRLEYMLYLHKKICHTDISFGT